MTSTGMPRDIDRILDAWFEDGPTLSADRVVGAALTRVEQTDQALRRWSPRVQREGRREWTRTLAIVIATGVLLVAAIGLTLGLGVIRLPEPSPMPAPSVEPSATAGAEAATSDTPVGTIRWTRVDSDTAIYPVYERGGQIIGRDYDAGSWWSTTDGISWTQTDPPRWGGSEEYVQVGDQTMAIVSPDGYSVMMGPASAREVLDWDWHDAEGDAAIYVQVGSEWQMLSLPRTAPPIIDGVRISSARLEDLAALDSTHWIVPAIHYVEIPWSEFLAGEDSADANAMWNEAEEQVEVFREGSSLLSGDPVAIYTVELVPGASPRIIFRDAESGRVVTKADASLPGWSPQEVMERLRGWGLEYASLIVASGENLRVVPAPWGGEEWGGSSVTFGNRYYTISLPYGPSYSAAGISLWESSDGIDWHRIDVPKLWDGTLDYATMAAGPDGLVLYVNEADDDGSVWTSNDARTWSKASIDPVLVGYPEPQDFGWLINAYDAAAISADGRSWQQIDLPSIPGEPTVTYLNGLFFYGPSGDSTGQTTWVGVLE